MSEVAKTEVEEKPKQKPKSHSGAGIPRKKSTEQKKKVFKSWKKDLVVTLETVIPELPKKADRLVAPNPKDHQDELDKIEKNITKTIKEYVRASCLMSEQFQRRSSQSTQGEDEWKWQHQHSRAPQRSHCKEESCSPRVFGNERHSQREERLDRRIVREISEVSTADEEVGIEEGIGREIRVI